MREGMALGSCRECGKQVSSEAKSCPYCGVDSPVRPTRTAFDTIRAVIKGLIAICILLIAANIFSNIGEAEREKERIEQQCLNEHPLNAKQISARAHFSTCWQYRRTPSSIWSDNQRNLMLLGESCYPDDRDDPRYLDANWDLCKPR
jgi:hypothetical protein